MLHQFMYNPCTNVPSKMICDIEGYKNYKDYSIDINGDIWSHKTTNCLKLRTYKAHRNGASYETVHLRNKCGGKNVFYVHRLVALAFLPNPRQCSLIEHIDGDPSNNHLDNLRWKVKRIPIKKEYQYEDTETLILSRELSDYIKLVHRACLHKGIPVPTTYEFFHGILNESLDEYIQRYGLKKSMYQLSIS